MFVRGKVYEDNEYYSSFVQQLICYFCSSSGLLSLVCMTARRESLFLPGSPILFSAVVAGFLQMGVFFYLFD